MKFFSERNPAIIGAIGTAVIFGGVVIGVQYKTLFNTDRKYAAYFGEAGGLMPGADVEVSGMQIGEVSGVELDGARVLVTFKVNDKLPIGDRSEAKIKTKSLLGTKFLEVTPLGGGRLSEPIPIDRTTPPYQIPDALGDLAVTIDKLDTDQLSASLSTLAETFRDTPPDLKLAVQGLTRFSQSLDARDAQLRDLLANANKATGVLAERTDKVVSLIANTNALLAELKQQSSELDRFSGDVGALSRQVLGFINDNRAQLRPALDKLNGVLTILDDRKEKVQKSIKMVNLYGMSFGEALSSGPFFKAYLANLLPGQFVEPFVEAAFSDLGLDPAVLLPSQLSDPQIGQKATPPLPVPYPRTGQGGGPHLTLPDTITGNPGDQPCGLPGQPVSGTGCYPYREPLPAPLPGGPPPGPPAPGPGQTGIMPPPTSEPVFVPAPGEPPREAGR